ncbi:CDP-glycerol glycerophosphotransferase family protein [Leuconostoc carnosum]|uniref:CDP-glycerol glycerophosphotransferase family protein n=1 Tax=Leuconostoc carnosum TaxID=1252 RepID=UPI000D5093DD|nr:CDP-glycerol glycerophosphotransferase family protein [Leuconostoc carnosum]SPJ44371.1 conserved hypothetical protein [Leuconostoc carnosum]
MFKKTLNHLRYLKNDRKWQKTRYPGVLTLEGTAKQFYDTHYDDWQVDHHLFLYDVRDGQQLDDSPFELLRYYLEKYPKTLHVIVAAEKHIDNIKQVLYFWNLQNDIRIIIVQQFSNQHMQYLLTAKCIITNAMIFSNILVKRGSQILVNTWHGTPLKKMGYAMPGGVMGSWNVIRTLMMTDYLVLPNQYTADIFKRDYRLTGLFKGEFVVAGYPRNDVLVNGMLDDQLKKMQVELATDQPVILYAPTWTGDSATLDGTYNGLEKYLDVLQKIQANYSNYAIKFKPHPYVYESILNDDRFAKYLIPSWLNTNALLAYTAILVTDYSSLFFDFLVTKRPIIFLDITDNYQRERGTYLGSTTLPGPFTTKVSDVIEWIGQIDQVQINYHEQYHHFVNEFVSEDDGNATQRVGELVQHELKLKTRGNLSVLVNGEDFSTDKFSPLVAKKISNKVDASIVVYVSHLLDNWYGKQFFSNVDDTMSNTRIFVNDDMIIDGSWQQLNIIGQRVVGTQTFDILLIEQQASSLHQKTLLTLSDTVVMVPNTQREQWLLALNYQYISSINDLAIWQTKAANPSILSQIKEELK